MLDRKRDADIELEFSRGTASGKPDDVSRAAATRELNEVSSILSSSSSHNLADRNKRERESNDDASPPPLSCSQMTRGKTAEQGEVASDISNCTWRLTLPNRRTHSVWDSAIIAPGISDRHKKRETNALLGFGFLILFVPMPSNMCGFASRMLPLSLFLLRFPPPPRSSSTLVRSFVRLSGKKDVGG